MAKVKGPKDGDILNATFHGKAVQHALKIENGLKGKTCLVLISVQGNDYCRDEWFRATVHDTLNAGFKHVTFLIVDKLQRYNMEYSSDSSSSDDEEELLATVTSIGDTWISENQDIFLQYLQKVPEFKGVHAYERIKRISDTPKKTDTTFDVIRWRDWIKQAEFKQEKKKIYKLFEQTPKIKTALEETAKHFMSRRGNSAHTTTLNSQGVKGKEVASHTLSDKKRLENSIQFLKKETAGVVYIGLKLRIDFVAYPDRMIKPIGAARDELMKKYFLQPEENKNESKKLLEWIHIQFRKSYSPQYAQNIKGKNSAHLPQQQQPLPSSSSSIVTSNNFFKPPPPPVTEAMNNGNEGENSNSSEAYFYAILGAGVLCGLNALGLPPKEKNRIFRNTIESYVSSTNISPPISKAALFQQKASSSSASMSIQDVQAKLQPTK